MTQFEIIDCEKEFWPPKKVASEIASDLYTYVLSGNELSIKDGKGVIEQLEDKFKRYYKKKFALSVNSGTSAINAALVALGITNGDEVICQTSTFHASITPILHCGGIPILCDILKSDGNIDIFQLKELITKRTKAIVITHMWGNPANMKEIINICQKRGIRIIEDCSHAHATIALWGRVGCFSDIAVFSLQASKSICAGEGGMLLTDNRDLYEKALVTSQFGERLLHQIENPELKRIWETGIGYKWRIHPLAAVSAIRSFETMDYYANKRSKRINLLYDQIEKFPFLKICRENDDERYTYFGNKVYYDKKENNDLTLDMVIQKASECGLGLHKASHRPLNELPFFKKGGVFFINSLHDWYKYQKCNFSNTRDYFDNLLSLPRFENNIPNEKICEYGKTLKHFFQSI